MSKEDELLIMMDAMANIIDKIKYLPADCPAVEESKVFQEIYNEIKELTIYMKERTAEVNRQIEVNKQLDQQLHDALKFNFGNGSKNN